MLDYAAHDSHFLLFIASRIQQEVMAKNNGKENLEKFFVDLNEKVSDIQYTLKED
jgi:hypothetical protein